MVIINRNRIWGKRAQDQSPPPKSLQASPRPPICYSVYCVWAILLCGATRAPVRLSQVQSSPVHSVVQGFIQRSLAFRVGSIITGSCGLLPKRGCGGAKGTTKPCSSYLTSFWHGGWNLSLGVAGVPEELIGLRGIGNSSCETLRKLSLARSLRARSSPQARLTWAFFSLVTGQSYSNVAIMLDGWIIRRLDRPSPSILQVQTRVIYTRSLAIRMQGPRNSRKGPKSDVSLFSLGPACVTVLALLGGDNVTVATGHYCMTA